ncbi:TerB N-terminal domain-containing protein [Paenibacillus kribbensis]|uniref:TerB N-terminal domain-containing protein n=1 Tax=Paenibacillus kribbensis TaxID=172713 RepID=UPI0008384BCB|nr:TerB N-terminal domain-containing protein [Paenibacillus kribbensis]
MNEIELGLTDVLILRKTAISFIESVGSNRIQFEIDPIILDLSQIPQPDDFIIQVVWNSSQNEVLMELPSGVEYLENFDHGWFKKGNQVWHLPDWTPEDKSWLFSEIQPAQFPFLLTNVLPDMINRKLPVYSPIILESQDAVHFQILEFGPDTIKLKVNVNVDIPRRIPGLEGYLLNGERLYPGPDPAHLNDFLSKHPEDENGLILLQGEDIPNVVAQIEGEWGRFTSGDVQGLLQAHPIQRAIELILTASVQISNGIGQVTATPMLKVEGVQMSAAAISRQLKPRLQYIRNGSGWIAVDDLRRVGIGVMGRAVNGLSLDNVFSLRAREVLERGGYRLEGPWSKIEFPEFNWPHQSSNPALDHLQFLARWGLNGGVKGGQVIWGSPLVEYLFQLITQFPKVQILMVGTKVMMESLKKQCSDTLKFTWITSSAEANRLQLKDVSYIAVTPSVLSKHTDLIKQRYDLLIMLEPDQITKSTDTKIYGTLSSIKSRCRFSLFSDANYLEQSNVKSAHEMLLQLHSASEQRWTIFDQNAPLALLPEPYQMKVNTSVKNSSDDLFFSEFDLVEPNEEDLGISIPASSISFQERTVKVSVEYESREQLFVKQAKSFADHNGEPAPFVQFMSYWPTYQDMTDSQQKWYFYWRSEVRNMRYPDTDLSYIFLHIYELINGVGWAEPKHGLIQLTQLLIHYGEAYRQLENYLFNWIYDFALVHQLTSTIGELDVLARKPDRLPGEFLAMELLNKFQESPLQLSLDMLLSLSNYDMKRSRFYLGEGKDNLEFYIPRILAVVDGYTSKLHDMRLIDMFSPGETLVTQRYLFRSAVYNNALYGSTFAVSYLPILNHEPLREYITHIIKFAENKLRDYQGFKGRLKGISLDPEVETLIDRYLSREYTKQSIASAIQIDTDKLAQLQSDTEYVREMLTIEEIEDSLETSSNPHMSEEVSHEPELAAHLQCATSEEAQSQDNSVKSSWDTTDLGEEWLLLAEALEEVHFKALAALTSDAPIIELSHLAEEHGTMPTLLIDDINQAAMEHIGDLIVSEDGVVEEYLNDVKNLKR